MKRFASFLAISAFLTTPASATPPNRAAEVFEQVCVNGGGEFAQGELESVNPSRIPTVARQLAMVALWLSAYDYEKHRFARTNEMPVQVFRVRGEGEMYLTLADDAPGNPLQASCAVYVQGDHYRPFAEYAANLTGSPLPNLERLNAHVGLVMGDHRVNVAILPGRRPSWTLIAATPLQFESFPEPSE